MKKVLLILVFMLLPVVCFGCESKKYIYDADIWQETHTFLDGIVVGGDKSIITKVNGYTIRIPDHVCDIKQLTKDGKICEVFGHEWKDSTSYESYYGVKMIKEETRVCKFCDKREIKKLPKWEKDNRTEEQRMEKYLIN